MALQISYNAIVMMKESVRGENDKGFIYDTMAFIILHKEDSANLGPPFSHVPRTALSRRQKSQ